MKDVKAMIPIIVLVLLISVVAGTFAWFSAYDSVDLNGSMEIGSYIDMIFDDSVGFPDLENNPYLGQTGYTENGDRITTEDAPYEFDFDLKFRIHASHNVSVKFGFKYIIIKLHESYVLGYAETVNRVFGATASDDPNSAEYKKFLGVKKEIDYKHGQSDNYYAIDKDGKYAPLKDSTALAPVKVTVYEPFDKDANRNEKGYLVVDDKTKEVKEIVLKSESVSEFFHLQYAFYPYQNETDKSVLKYQKFDVPSTPFEYKKTKTDPTVSGQEPVSGYEVFEDSMKCYPHKANIKIGLYHDNKIAEPGKASEFGPFVFSEGAFKGCRFTFVFRVEGKEV